MFIYEKRISIHYFKNFKEAQSRLDTLMSIHENFEITVDYSKDLPVCVKSEFYYPVEKEA